MVNTVLHMDLVLYRTGQPLSNEEESLASRLSSLRRDARALLDELADPFADAAAVDDASTEATKSASSFFSGFRSLSPSSPYREGALAEALFWLSAISEAGASHADARIGDAVDIDEQLLRAAELAGAVSFGSTLMRARTDARLNLRRLAEVADISPGYLSEIERGKRDVPSPEAARKLDQALGTRLQTICVCVKEGSTAIKGRIAERALRRTSSASNGFDLSDPDNVRLVDGLSRDPDIRRVVDIMLSLPKPAIKGIRDLAEKLREI